MNNLQLKATRQGLGLTVADAAELMSVEKRTFQRWESGDRSVPADVDLKFFTMSSHYTLVLDKLLSDIAALDKKPILPFYITFEAFQMATECPHVAYWRIYQSVISHLILIGKITKLDDTQPIPPEFSIWKWLKGAYEHKPD